MTDASKLLDGTTVRYTWYQTEQYVVVNILQKNLDVNRLGIQCTENKVTINLPGINEPFELNLSHEISSENFLKKVTPSKLEIKFLKKEAIQWKTLEKVEKVQWPFSKPPKNWDAIVKSEEGDDDIDPMNALLQKIYQDGGDEVKKAMNKSFSESNGTVLSTNWKEVAPGKVDMKPADGVEWKPYN